MRTLHALTGPILGCCLLVTLAACSDVGPPYAHHPLTPLSLPHVTRLPAFSQLAPKEDADQIYSLYTFVLGAEHRAQALVAVDGNLYVTNLDGSGKRRIGLTYPCFEPAITPDGDWLACPNETDESHDHDELQVTSLRPNAPGGVRIVHLQRGGFYVHPAWSPDGREVAIVRDRDNTTGGCSIVIYAARPPYATFTHVVELTSQAIIAGSCIVHSLSWSPDGKDLAVAIEGVALLPVQPVPGSLPPGQPAGHAVDVPPTAFTVVPGELGGHSPIWNRQTGALAYMDADKPPQRILSYDPKTRASRTLLTVPSVTRTAPGTEQVEWLAWTPDDRQILFVVGETGYCVDCNSIAPSDVYVFTP